MQLPQTASTPCTEGVEAINYLALIPPIKFPTALPQSRGHYLSLPILSSAFRQFISLG